MRILHVSDGAGDELGPLIEALAALGVAGDLCAVDAARSPRGWWTRARAIRRALAAGEHTLVHAHGATAAVAAATAERRVPVVAHLRNELSDGGRARAAQWAARLCGHVLVPDALSAVRLRGGDVRVVPIGVDSARFAPRPRATACAALGLDASRTFIAAPASPLVPAVVERVRRALPTATLLALDDVAADTRALVYNAADVLVVPAPSAAAPRLVREALACNLPIVSVRCGDVPRLLAGVFPSTLADGNAEALAASAVSFLRAGARSDGRTREPLLNVRRTAHELARYYAELGARTSAAATPVAA